MQPTPFLAGVNQMIDVATLALPAWTTLGHLWGCLSPAGHIGRAGYRCLSVCLAEWWC